MRRWSHLPVLETAPFDPKLLWRPHRRQGCYLRPAKLPLTVWQWQAICPAELRHALAKCRRRLGMKLASISRWGSMRGGMSGIHRSFPVLCSVYDRGKCARKRPKRLTA
jgi:hypothetical protein